MTRCLRASKSSFEFLGVTNEVYIKPVSTCDMFTHPWQDVAPRRYAILPADDTCGDVSPAAEMVPFLKVRVTRRDELGEEANTGPD